MERQSSNSSEKSIRNSYSYGFSPLAVKDIDEVLSYISGELLNQKAASDLYDKIFSTIDVCRTFPYGAPDCSIYGISNPSFRHSRVGNYVLFFRVDENKKRLWIIRFLYSARDINSESLNQ